MSIDDASLRSIVVRVSGIIEESISNGPGLRMVIFAQGCKHHCLGCHNPQSHDFEGGYEISIGEIMDMVRDNALLDGITLSGGDPFEQAYGFSLLAGIAKSEGYHVTTYTGYTFEQLVDPKMSQTYWDQLLLHTDLLVDGPFIASAKNGLLKFRGSDNQRLIDVSQSMDSASVVLAAV